MTPEIALVELFGRVGARHGAPVFVSADELSQWPAAEVAAMKAQKLLVKARPAVSVVCPGCEWACVMRVHTVSTPSRGPASFVVCDKRLDINRVPLSAELLMQWRCDAEAVCRFVANNFGLHRSEQPSSNPAVWNIGIGRGDTRSQMVCIQATGKLALVVGNNAVPLAELVGFRDGEYAVDAAMIRQLIDSATTADPRYTPSNAKRESRKLDTQAIYEDWRKAYRGLKKQRPHMSDVWYSKQIAKLEIAAGRDAETIRKHMKK